MILNLQRFFNQQEGDIFLNFIICFCIFFSRNQLFRFLRLRVFKGISTQTVDMPLLCLKFSRRSNPYILCQSRRNASGCILQVSKIENDGHCPAACRITLFRQIYLSASINLCSITAISALVASSCGLSVFSDLPFIKPLPTAYCNGAVAYPEMLSKSS